MKFLPVKFSFLWGWVLVCYTVFIFSFLVLAQWILQTEFTTRSYISFAIIAVISGFIVCFGGFWGAKFYFVITSLSALAGMVYMMYIVIFNVSPGWGDITSIIGYLFCLAIGAGIGIVIELILWLTRMIRKKREQN